MWKRLACAENHRLFQSATSDLPCTLCAQPIPRPPRPIDLEPSFAPTEPLFQPFVNRFPFLSGCFLSARDKKAVVFSRGALSLDDCDFSGSSASVLVYSEGDTPMIRNAVLGDENCESFDFRTFRLQSFCTFLIPNSPAVAVRSSTFLQPLRSYLCKPSSFVHPAQATSIPGFGRLRRQWSA